MYGLLTKCKVKMAGYWPSSFFLDRDGVEVHKLAKKELGQYPAISTEQAWSITDLIYGFREKFSCRTRRAVPSGQDNSILPARVANHSARFDSSCPLTERASTFWISTAQALIKVTLSFVTKILYYTDHVCFETFMIS